MYYLFTYLPPQPQLLSNHMSDRPRCFGLSASQSIMSHDQRRLEPCQSIEVRIVIGIVDGKDSRHFIGDTVERIVGARYVQALAVCGERCEISLKLVRR